MRTPQQTATLIAVILKRAGDNRARVSEKSIKLLSGQRRLRSSFVTDLKEAVAQHSWSMFELGRGGFGLIEMKALDSAPTVLPKNYLNEGELKSVKSGVINFSKLEAELPEPEEGDEGDDAD